MSICTESTRGLREPVLQVLVAARVFLGQRVNLQEKYDYPWGKHTMKLGSNRLTHSHAPSPKGWVMKHERRTPRYTTQWEEMPLVRM